MDEESRRGPAVVAVLARAVDRAARYRGDESIDDVLRDLGAGKAPISGRPAAEFHNEAEPDGDAVGGFHEEECSLVRSKRRAGELIF